MLDILGNGQQVDPLIAVVEHHGACQSRHRVSSPNFKSVPGSIAIGYSTARIYVVFAPGSSDTHVNDITSLTALNNP